MVHAAYVLVALCIPVVSGLSVARAHGKDHASRHVKLIEVNETVRASSSDLVFSWEECLICDGYEAHLYLDDVFGTREIPYKLKSAVAALEITDVPPRTAYKLVVNKLPSDTSGSDVSGRTHRPEAPPPVENLVARALTSSSIRIDWNPKDADGFVARVLENNNVVYETVVPSLSKLHTLEIADLAPEKIYTVQVAAYYAPRTEESISSWSSCTVKTLPAILPNLRLSATSGAELKLFWNNPESPKAMAHRIHCARGSMAIFDAELSGSTDFVAPGVSGNEETHCTLQTWFSEHEQSKVETQLIVPKSREDSSATEFTDHLWCSSTYPVVYSARVHLKQNEAAEGPLVRFSERHSDYLKFKELQYRLCEEDRSCGDSWTSLPSNQYPELLLKPGMLEPWRRFFVEYRFYLRCYYDNYGEKYTTARSLAVPVLTGPIHPVRELSASESGVSWEYDSSSVPLDYFLVTYCADKKCTSRSVPAEDRSVDFGEQSRSVVYDVTVQAVKLRDGKAYASPTEMISFLAKDPEFSDHVTLEYEEIADSPMVKLLIAHNSSSAVQPVEYHIDVCSKRLPLWEAEELVEEFSSTTACVSSVSTISSFNLVREPWTSHEVSVLICYGVSNPDDPVNLTLPVFKPNPSPISEAELFLDQGGALVRWNYEHPAPSGFFISVCPLSSDAPLVCNQTKVGPLAESYLMNSPESVDTVSVTPFLVHEGSFYNATSTELRMPQERAAQSDIRR